MSPYCIVAEVACIIALIFFTATGDHQRTHTLLLMLILLELVRGNEARRKSPLKQDDPT